MTTTSGTIHVPQYDMWVEVVDLRSAPPLERWGDTNQHGTPVATHEEWMRLAQEAGHPSRCDHDGGGRSWRKPFFIYLIRSRGGASLYVGITSDPSSRLRSHVVSKCWYREMDEVWVLGPACCRRHARAIERAAQIQLRPTWNSPAEAAQP